MASVLRGFDVALSARNHTSSELFAVFGSRSTRTMNSVESPFQFRGSLIACWYSPATS
jgi:hypothetical protein